MRFARDSRPPSGFRHSHNYSSSDQDADAVNSARREFVTLAQSCGLPFVDYSLFDAYLVTCCTGGSQQGFGTSPDSETRAFVPTVDVLQSLNIILRQQQRLCTEALAASTRREATVHVILTESCAASRGIFPRNHATTSEVQCTCATHERLVSLLKLLDEHTDDVVSCIRRWRRNLRFPQPFFVNGENYLLRIRKQIDAIVKRCHYHLHSKLVAGDEPTISTSTHQADDDSDGEVADGPPSTFTSHYLQRSNQESRKQTIVGTGVIEALRRRLSNTEEHKVSDLVRAVYNEHSLQQRYIDEALARNAAGRYALCLKTTIDLSHTSCLHHDEMMHLRRAAMQREQQSWLPLPLIVPLPLDADDVVASLTGARHIEFVAVDESGCVPFQLMRHIFHPSPGKSDTTNRSTRHGAPFNQHVQTWINKCLRCAQEALAKFMDAADGGNAENDVQLSRDQSRSNAETSAYLLKKTQKRKLQIYFDKWISFIVVSAANRRVLNKLRAITAMHLRRRFYHRWYLVIRGKMSQSACAASLCVSNERRLRRLRFTCMMRLRMIRLVSRSLSAKLFQMAFGRWMFFILCKRGESAAKVSEASWREQSQRRVVGADGGGHTTVVRLPPPRSLVHLYSVAHCCSTDAGSERLPLHLSSFGKIALSSSVRAGPLSHLRAMYQIGVQRCLDHAAPPL